MHKPISEEMKTTMKVQIRDLNDYFISNKIGDMESLDLMHCMTLHFYTMLMSEGATKAEIILLIKKVCTGDVDFITNYKHE